MDLPEEEALWPLPNKTCITHARGLCGPFPLLPHPHMPSLGQEEEVHARWGRYP